MFDKAFDAEQFRPKDVYVQCDVERTVGTQTIKQTTWLPKIFAEVGRYLKLRDLRGCWEDGWTVTHVYTKRIGVPHVQGDVRTHRANTGDSLPKRESTHE